MLDRIFDQTRSSNRYIGIKGSAERACPIGISSKEGWKDTHIKNISKSGSLSASSSDTLICNMTDKSLVVDEVVVEHENFALCFEFPSHMVTEMSDSISVRNDSTPRSLDSSFAKVTCGPSEEGSVSFCHVVHEPESLAHSKEADVEPDQPSPASVLEAPFLDDLSLGSECFGSLSAELQASTSKVRVRRICRMLVKKTPRRRLIIREKLSALKRAVNLRI